jgi:hypothetical protein
LTVRPWRVAASLDTLRKQINEKAPKRNKLSDGTIGDPRHQARTSDHNAWIVDGPHRVVSALDITHDPADGVDCNLIAEAIRTDPRVKYIIWNRRISNPTIERGKWRPYKGSNGHTHHIHISVKSTKAHYDDAKPWKL